jgi:predicted dehydrogenase
MQVVTKHPLRIGLVGTGFIAPYHLEAFRQCPEAMIAGLCAHAETERLKQLSAEWGVRAYPSFDALVSDPAIDALVLGSWNSDHAGQIRRCQELGKPALVEKPVVTALTELDAIRESVARTGVPVMPAHNFVYRGAVKAAHAIMRSGQMGQAVYASFTSNHTISAEHASGWRGNLSIGGGGALMDSGHHQVYQALHLLGRPEELHAFCSRLMLTGMEGEDIAQIQMRYANGALATILQSWTNNQGTPVDGIRIVGTAGWLQITDALYVNGECVDSDTTYPNSFVNQAQAFVDLVRHGTPPASTLDDARDTLAMILLAYESAKTSTVLRFPAT